MFANLVGLVQPFSKLLITGLLIIAWFTYCLYAGFQKWEILQNWAFYNKYIGLFVLFGYLLTCFMVGRLLKIETLRQIFFLRFALCMFHIVVFSTYKFLSVVAHGEKLWLFYSFAGTPNSYGFGLCVMFLFKLSFFER